jgi:phosphopantetheinyl transferase
MRLVTRVGECDVWLVDLHASDEQYARAFALLSHAERARARAIRGEKARRMFVLARGALRVRLADVLAIEPEQVTLRPGEHGKPELVAPPGVGGPPLREHGEPELVALPGAGGPPLREHGEPELVAPPGVGGPPLREHGEPELVSPPGAGLPIREHGKPEIAPPSPRAEVSAAHVNQGLPRFNLAHRDGVALIAISHRRHETGVDLERIAPASKRSWHKLLERICHPCEAREALAEARTIGSRAFYERWVGKEAVLKALGVGLRVAPADVPLRRDSGGVLRVGGPFGRRGPASGLLDTVGADRHLAAWTNGPQGCTPAGCRLEAVPAPAGFVGALALVEPVS